MQEKNTEEQKKDLDIPTSRKISDEVLRYHIRKLIDEPKPESRLSFLKHPLASIIVAFLLTGLLGQYLTNLYSSNQKELERKRSFADEINKTRVSKIGEVWEKVDVYEAEVKLVMERFEMVPNTSQGVVKGPVEKVIEKFEQTERLHTELSGLLDKNRFWLGDRLYDEIKQYTDTTYEHFLAWKSKKTPKELEELEVKRRNSRSDINQTRDKMLKGEI